MMVPKPYLREISLKREKISDLTKYPFTIPAVRHLDVLRFDPDVTFLVGENGSGKSTLLEGLAAGMDAVTAGGADIERDETLAAARRFAAGYRFSRKNKPRARLFVRAEDLFGFVRRVSRDMRDLAEMEETAIDLAMSSMQLPAVGVGEPRLIRT